MDNMLFKLILSKGELIAEADEWRNQEIIYQSPQGVSAMNKIRREIAGLDSKINDLRRMGAKEVGVEPEPALQGDINPTPPGKSKPKTMKGTGNAVADARRRGFKID
jgi:hypothetical protein